MKKPNWGAIKAYYARHTLAIYTAGRSDWGLDPYQWEFEAGIELTPIERAIWSDIRAVGIVMYPQYPVAGFFVDFGNPVARVAIECDGRRWHIPEQDAKRQQAIEDNGWEVYRLGGRECMQNTEVVEQDDGRLKTIPSPGYLMVREIADRHGIRFGAERKVPA